MIYDSDPLYFGAKAQRSIVPGCFGASYPAKPGENVVNPEVGRRCEGKNYPHASEGYILGGLIAGDGRINWSNNGVGGSRGLNRVNGSNQARRTTSMARETKFAKLSEIIAAVAETECGQHR